MRLTGSSVFAELLQSLTPYLGDLVVVGGWVQALYILEAEGGQGRVVRTADIDLSLGSPLEQGGRPPFLDLLRTAGFQVEAFDDESGFEVSKDMVEIDLLAEGVAGGSVPIDGQPDLRVFGYPHQDLLRTNTRRFLAGSDVDPSLDPPVEVLIPTKGFRIREELMAREQLAAQILEGLPEMTRAYRAEVRSAREWLTSVLESQFLIEAASRQIIESSGFLIDDDTPVRAEIVARLRRLLAEGLS